MALLFYPRGGSSQVVRYLARFLPEADWDVRIATGSLGSDGMTVTYSCMPGFLSSGTAERLGQALACSSATHPMHAARSPKRVR